MDTYHIYDFMLHKESLSTYIKRDFLSIHSVFSNAWIPVTVLVIAAAIFQQQINDETFFS